MPSSGTRMLIQWGKPFNLMPDHVTAPYHFLSSSNRCLLVPHIFVWGSCFWFCTSAFLLSPAPLPARPTCSHTTCPLTTSSHTTCHHTTCSHTTWHHTTCSHTTCHHTTCSHAACHHTTCSHTTCHHTTYSHTTCSHSTCHHTTYSHTTCHRTTGALGSQLTPLSPRLLAW